jgi:hypothetical protein
MKLSLVCRRFERRWVSERQAVNSEQVTEDKNMKVQKLARKNTNLLREDEPRQSARRTSRPTLLSVDEIATLRKNQLSLPLCPFDSNPLVCFILKKASEPFNLLILV